MYDVMAIGAHPDDVEFGCGGILAKLASQGKKIVIVDLTLGEMGTNGTPSERRNEAHYAAHLIGAERVNLEIPDCNVQDNETNREKLVAVMREYKPKLVLTTQWMGTQNHPDHLACGELSRHACRLSRFKSYLPHLPPHRPDGILHYIQRTFVEPTFIVDITEHVETWKKMVQSHKTQMGTLPYFDMLLKKAAALGVHSGVEYAQGLIAGNPVVIDDIMDVATGTQEI